jgi:uncharacterized protein YprB with RNaseH-like and TPR domain
VRLALLHDRDIRTWADVLDAEDCLPAGACWRQLAEECRRCLAALDDGEIRYFTDRFASQDKWRILSHYLDQASYFDIETVGLEYNAAITVISCWHDGRLHTFVEHENLDEFLDLLDEISLLVSFNGSSFDVPRLLDTFHIPDLPCAHIDMRWTCFHQGLTGGLKEIADRAGIVRPMDLQSADGELAVRLWFDWRNCQNRAARELLIRYCASDVLMLIMLAHQQLGRVEISQDELWTQLPTAPLPEQGSIAASATVSALDGSFGSAYESQFGAGSPTFLRARRTRRVG